MKTHVKLVATLLCVALMLCAAPLYGFVGLNLPDFSFSLSAKAAVETGTCGTSLNWSLNTDTGALTISGTGDMSDYYTWSDVSPWYNSTAVKSVIIESGVTSIGNFAFYGCSKLTSVIIHAGVKTIGNYSFLGCEALTSIAIPYSVTSIGDGAFTFCNSLTSITIPDSVTSIGETAFKECTALTEIVIPKDITRIEYSTFGDCTGLTSVTLPDKLTAIDSSAFYGCTGLLSITIPETVETIGYTAFSGCTGLSSVDIPAGVTTVKEWAFYGCTRLTAINVADGNSHYCDVDGVLFNKTKTDLMCYPAAKTGVSYDMPDSVTNIGSGAFGECKSLTSISASDALTNIRDRAFYKCTGLTSINIPDKVTNIGEYAFYGCKGLTSIKIPASVTFIDCDAFSDCTGLTSITLNAKITEINNSVFKGCTGLLSIDIPGTVTNIETYAFSGCTGLATVNMPDSVVFISSSAFFDCTSLTSINIPKSVTGIEHPAFNGCTKLAAINVHADNTKYVSDNGVLFNKDKTRLICYPAGKTDTVYTVPDSVTTVGYYAFEGCTGLKSIVMPDGVTGIDYEAFIDCTGLLSIDISDRVTSIGSSAFEGCTGLTSIDIPVGVKSIGEYAFYNCTGLTAFNVDADNTEYSSGDGVLFNKDKTELICYPAGRTATVYTVPDSVTDIYDSSFTFSKYLTTIEIPDGVTNIGDFQFFGCKSLTAINIDENNPDYSSVDGVLFNKEKTELICYPAEKTNATYIIPASVLNIGEYAFAYNTRLTSVTLSEKVANIGELAFEGCSSLTSVTIGSNVTQIGFGVFFFCTRLTSINVSENNKDYSSADGVLFNKEKTRLICYPAGKTDKFYVLPESVNEIYSGAFADTVFLKDIYIFSNKGNNDASMIGYSMDENVGDFVCNVPTVIHAKPGSTAEIYADENKLQFSPLKENCSHVDKVIINATLASCVVAGYSGDTFCKDCGKIIAIGKANYAEHVWGAWTVTEASTIKKEGTEKRVCRFCKKEDTRSIAKLPPVINVNTGSEIKLSADEKYVLTIDGMNTDKLLENVNEDVTIITAEGKAVKAGDKAASGMKLVIKDGDKQLDSKTIIILGDVDGDGIVSAFDARLALRCAVKLETLSEWQAFAANTDGEENVTAADARLILRASVKLEKIVDWLAEYK